MRLEQPFSRSVREGGALHSGSAVFSDPAQIVGQSGNNWNKDYFGDFIRMKGSQLLLKRCLSIRRCLEKSDHFASGFNLVFPTIDRVNSWNNVGTCRELFGNQRVRDAIGRLRIWKSTDRE